MNDILKEMQPLFDEVEAMRIQREKEKEKERKTKNEHLRRNIKNQIKGTGN
jgi:hypothetical protein